MRLGMDSLSGFLGGRVHETEDVAAFLVHPVRQVPRVILLLNLQVEEVCGVEIRGRDFARFMAIHIHRHRPAPLTTLGLVLIGGRLIVSPREYLTSPLILQVPRPTSISSRLR